MAGDPASSVSTGDSVADEVDGTTGTMGAANGASGGLGTDRDVVDAREGAESIKRKMATKRRVSADARSEKCLTVQRRRRRQQWIKSARGSCGRHDAQVILNVDETLR